MPSATVNVMSWKHKEHIGETKVHVATTTNCNSSDNGDFRMEVGWEDVMAQVTVLAVHSQKKER